jgi:hypothetical protein
VALSEGTSAAVPAPLAGATIQAATLLAAGPAAAVMTPAAALMKEVLKTMFLTKLKLAVTAVMVAVVLGASGLVYRAAGQGGPEREAGRPRTEVEALRRENELLKFNLEVVLEKCRAQEAELRTFRAQAAAQNAKRKEDLAQQVDQLMVERLERLSLDAAMSAQVEHKKALDRLYLDVTGLRLPPMELKKALDPARAVEAAIKELRQARHDADRERALQKLEAALKDLRQQLKPADKTPLK